MADSSWRKDPAAKPYIKAIEAAAKKHGIPADTLGSLIQRESRFKPDARSRSGARGIAQIMPRAHPGVRYDDPTASINYAAQYLAHNVRRFGDMRKALAAYNHGPTNISRYGNEWEMRIPRETQNYINALAPLPPRPVAPPAPEVINLLRSNDVGR